MSKDDSRTGAHQMTGTEFTRDTDYISTRITRDGRDGYPVGPGRYRLIAARACPGPTGRSSFAGCSASTT